MINAGGRHYARNAVAASDIVPEEPGANIGTWRSRIYGVQELAMGVLSVRHLTTNRYAEPVRPGEHRMMFRPRESHDLRLIRTRLKITPHPADLHWLHDVFDHSVTVANFDCATTLLQFDSMITLQHIETRLPDYAMELAARSFPFDYPCDEQPDLAQALHRSDPSLEVDQWAARFLPSRVLPPSVCD